MGVSLPHRANADPINQVIDNFLRECRWHRVSERRVGTRGKMRPRWERLTVYRLARESQRTCCCPTGNDGLYQTHRLYECEWMRHSAAFRIHLDNPGHNRVGTRLRVREQTGQENVSESELERWAQGSKKCVCETGMFRGKSISLVRVDIAPHVAERSPVTFCSSAVSAGNRGARVGRKLDLDSGLVRRIVYARRFGAAAPRFKSRPLR